MGEQFIRLDAWDDKILRLEIREMDAEESKLKARLGLILLDEMLDFHYSLEQSPHVEWSEEPKREDE